MPVRIFVLAYAAGGYLVAMASLAYLVGFMLSEVVPKGINDGPTGPVLPAVAVDLALIGLFGLHHSATARTWFKRRWTRVIPPAAERATYLYMTAVATVALVWFWRPIPITIWQVEDVALWSVVVIANLGVWAAMFVSTFPIGHFDFFGLAQAWRRVRGRAAPDGRISTAWLYGLVRHPISLGWITLPWLTPHFTLGQLVFALGVAVYVLIATIHEEADLVDALGDGYRRYRLRVPKFLPRLVPRRARDAEADDAASERGERPEITT